MRTHIIDDSSHLVRNEQPTVTADMSLNALGQAGSKFNRSPQEINPTLRGEQNII